MAIPTRAEELARQDVQHVVHPITPLAEHERSGPLIIAEGEGIYVRDAEGRRYIDTLAGLWNVNVGHGRGEIADAMAEQARRIAFAPMFWGRANVPSIELATKLAAIAPPGLTRIFYTSGGSESNETAIKMARYYFRVQGFENKYKVIARRRGYHGVSYGALSATGIPDYHRLFGPMAPGFLHIDPPYLYRESDPARRAALSRAENLEQSILAEGPETVAAFIAEPIQGVGGVIVPPDEYFPAVRAICDRYNVLFIADEVITGYGRTGHWFGLNNWNVVPDIMSTAKGITSGYVPLGAVFVSEKLYGGIKASESVFMHGFTYNGHPVACAAALANLAIFEREGLVEHAAMLAPYFLGRLNELRRFRHVGDVRGCGLMAAIELVADAKTGEPFDAAKKVGATAAKTALRHGLLARAAGDILVFAPPLVIDERGVDELVDGLARTLDECGL
ncbi:MAG: aspartate aminotransferase family protein [Chloroflexi bacterium]|nr:aspartate aminotransferase family protein [Chloroflexota bacterium]